MQSSELVQEWAFRINEAIWQSGDRPHSLLVLLNPFGGTRKAKEVWRDIAAPVFELAGAWHCQPYYACWFDLLLLVAPHCLAHCAAACVTQNCMLLNRLYACQLHLDLVRSTLYPIRSSVPCLLMICITSDTPCLLLKWTIQSSLTKAYLMLLCDGLLRCEMHDHRNGASVARQAAGCRVEPTGLE